MLSPTTPNNLHDTSALVPNSASGKPMSASKKLPSSRKNPPRKLTSCAASPSLSMLSRLFSSVRKIISFENLASEATIEAENSTPQNADMVRTRQQSGQAALAGEGDNAQTKEEAPVELSLNDSRKRRRNLEKEVESPAPKSAIKRQRKTVLPAKVEETTPIETHTHYETEIPVSSLIVKKGEAQSLDEIPSSAAEDKDNVEDTEESTPSKNTKSKRIPTSKPKLSKKATIRAMKPSAEQISSAISNILAKPKHKRFGSEEPVQKVEAVTQPTLAAEESEEDEEDSDDEAPEEVATGAAEENVRRAEREAVKAAEVQEAESKRKRKDLDEKLKLQAKQARKRREDYDNETNGDRSEDEGDQAGPQISTKPKLDRRNLPAFLPAEYLSDTEEVPNLPSSTHTRTPPKNNHLKFLEEKRPKDVRVGSTTIRVAKKLSSGAGLAPKADHNTKSTKDDWLQKRKMQAGGRRPHTAGGASGFFVKGDKKRK